MDFEFEDVNVDAIVARIRATRSPTRVVVDEAGTALTPRRARARGIQVDVVFIRSDGWTLGAPRELEETARNLWSNDWVRRIRWETL